MLRTILIAIPMMFSLIMGSLAFIAPDILSEILGVSADNAVGRGTMTGDFAAFFLTSTLALGFALFKGKTYLLWVSISLLGITLIGRIFSIVVDGAGEGVFTPMIGEAMLIAMLLGAMQLSKQEAKS